MQRQEFLQQLWLDYIHLHPELGALRVWPVESTPEYLALLTLNHERFSTSALLPALQHFGYRCVDRHAMADRGLLITLLSPPDDGSWLVLCELQLGTLTRTPLERLTALVNQAHPEDCRGQNLLCRGRPWPMPDWETYRLLERAHPLAAWLAVAGPRLHHAGFDCMGLGHAMAELDERLQQAGLFSNNMRQQGIFPISHLLDYRYYPTCPQRHVFADGDEHRIDLGGLALIQRCLPGSQERAAELLLPQHTRCKIA
ncbi:MULTISPECIES: DUF1338 domain-containing protein [Halomonadaceae]|uniref:DUF1338 domain-containing protein n=1 Tax=Halomonadaceae TaxID=28256 RepID=UPI00159B2AE8|nr:MULTISPECIES: DUF1338 domain-containing protein [Halomonas]QJQ96693.1 DUF1338 domain-containing protein [Halomonas sp. PA5]